MVTTFPAHILGVEVDLLLNGVWTNITPFVLARDNVVISGIGRADEQASIQASQMTLTLNNADGRFTPGLSTGAYYPYIARNIQCRLSISSESSTLVTYTGYRFWGEVTEWPIAWDQTGKDVYSQIVVSGVWRRLSQMSQTLGSAFTRYMVNLNYAPRAYWPMEDGSGALSFMPLIGGAGAPCTWVGTPSLASGGSFPGADAIWSFNNAFATATVPSGGTPTYNVTRFLLSVPTGGDSGSGTTNWNVVRVNSAGTVVRFECYLNYGGTLLFQLRSSPTTVLASATTTLNVTGVPVLVSLELVPSGSSVVWTVNVIKPGATSITETHTGTLTSSSIGAISTVQIDPSSALTNTCFGHLAVSYQNPPNIPILTAANALGGWSGEYAMDRFTRLCSETGFAYETIGTDTTTAPMGPQTDDTLANLLQMIENTDCGLLYESRTQLAIGYRAQASIANQAATLVLSYAAATLAAPIAVTYDDQLVKNSWVVTNQNGYSIQTQLSVGAMSIQAPPNGIGSGYQGTRTVCTSANTQVNTIANWLLGVSAVGDIRIPTVTLDMTRPEVASLFATIPGMRVGDYMQITNPPSFLASATIGQLTWGMTETINAFVWTIEYNTVPESPWTSGYTPGTIQLNQLMSQSATSSSANQSEANALIGMIQNGLLGSLSFNAAITALSPLLGIAITIALSAPATPNVGDIWISSTTGLMEQWNGTVWVAITFNATDVIQAGTISSALIEAGTIVASNISAGTITASLLASNIVVAGIVDSTEVQASQYICTSAQGEFLAYSGSSGGSGTLATSISGAAGVDAWSNPYPAGFLGNQITLKDISAGPPTFAGASVLYSDFNGRLWFNSGVGVSAVVDRTTVNVHTFTIGATTTYSQASAAFPYIANEANQSSSFRLEILGGGTWASTTPDNINFALYMDGSPCGGGSAFTVDASGFGASNTFSYDFGWTWGFLVGGSSATIIIQVDGVFGRTGTLMVPSQSIVVTGTQSVACDATVDHTFMVYASMQSGNPGQGIITNITKIMRMD